VKRLADHKESRSRKRRKYERPDGRFARKVTIGREAGKQIQVTVYGATRAEMDAKYEALRREVTQNGVPDLTRVTLEEHLRTWLAAKEHTVKHAVYLDYRYHVEHYIIPRLGGKLLRKLTSSDVERALLDIASFAPASAAKCRARLVNALEKAVAFHLVPRNVAKPVSAPRRVRREIEFWTPAEVRCFLAFTRQARFHAAFVVALGTGMRMGEILGLQWADVGERIITVRRNVTQAYGKRSVSTPKTEAGWRRVPYGSEVAAALREHGERYGRSPERYIFGTHAGGAMHPKNFGREYRKLVARLNTQAKARGEKGVKPLHFHGLRHTFASLAVADGMDVRTLGVILGHRRPSMTLDIYSHFFESRREGSALSLMAALDKAEGSDEGSK
jgi:integrase